MDLNENEIVEIVIGAAIGIHRDLGPGLLESVYERVLTRVLFEKGLRVDVQRVIPLVYRGENLGDAFRADMIINEKVIVELKSVRAIEDVF